MDGRARDAQDHIKSASIGPSPLGHGWVSRIAAPFVPSSGASIGPSPLGHGWAGAGWFALAGVNRASIGPSPLGHGWVVTLTHLPRQIEAASIGPSPLGHGWPRTNGGFFASARWLQLGRRRWATDGYLSVSYTVITKCRKRASFNWAVAVGPRMGKNPADNRPVSVPASIGPSPLGHGWQKGCRRSRNCP